MFIDFKGLLKNAGITKAELARQLGLNPRTVSAWGSNPPNYAMAYLTLLIKCKALEVHFVDCSSAIRQGTFWFLFDYDLRWPLWDYTISWLDPHGAHSDFKNEKVLSLIERVLDI